MTRRSGDAPAFAGFWMGGYEGADHVNGHGLPLDLVRASGHLDRLDEDHRRAAQAGLRVVRESIGWRLSEAAGGAIDLGRALRVQASARRHGLQVLWTLMHYGLPTDLNLNDDALIPRLARFAAEVARVLARGSERPPVYTPINEIGFVAWAAAHADLLHGTQVAGAVDVADPAAGLSAEAALQAARLHGYAVKCRLVRATIAAQQAMRRVDPHARFLHVEPLVHVAPPLGRAELAAQAELVRSWQWQAWDLIAGRLEPALGGAPALLDLVGINHYHGSQWELGTNERLDWHRRDPRRRPLHLLLAEAAHRYGRPLVVAETGHVGAGRADWLHEVAAEVRQARQLGVPVQGICLYPLVDRPDWQEPARWHRSGLWHVDTAPWQAARRDTPGLHTPTMHTPTMHAAPMHPQPPAPAPHLPRPGTRHADRPALQALRAWQAVLPSPHAVPRSPPVVLAFSHRRWDGLRHRGRHLLERLAGGPAPWRVVFVEEPRRCTVPRLHHCAAGPFIDVLVPHTLQATGGFDTVQQPLLHSLLAGWLAEQGIHRPLAWLDTPRAAPLVQALHPARVVYDWGDGTAAASGAAPAETTQEATLEAAHEVACGAAQEAALLASADLVLGACIPPAGVRALAGTRLRLLPNGVDPAFCARRRSLPGGWPRDEVLQLPLPPPAAGPRVGYAGPVDERVDLALLAALADARPHWHWVLAGPVLDIDPATLPRRPNLHWLGPLHASLMPELLATWQLALLPWLCRATPATAQPLQVWDALAAGLAVVAPPLPGLLAWQGAGVRCAVGAQAVLQACDSALAEPTAARRARRRRARRQLRPRRWDALARALAQILLAPAPVAWAHESRTLAGVRTA